RIGFEALANLVRGTPELAVVRGACCDLAVPIKVDGKALSSVDLVRLPLGDDLAGFIAVVDPAMHWGPAMMEVAEHGAVIARYAIDLWSTVPRGSVPVRLYIDAPRMPTNASRSQVRRDEHPIAAAEERARKLLPELVAALAAKQGDRVRAAALA